MIYLIGEVAAFLLIAFVLGLLIGWLWPGRRFERLTAEWGNQHRSLEQETHASVIQLRDGMQSTETSWRERALELEAQISALDQAASTRDEQIRSAAAAATAATNTNTTQDRRIDAMVERVDGVADENEAQNVRIRQNAEALKAVDGKLRTHAQRIDAVEKSAKTANNTATAASTAAAAVAADNAAQDGRIESARALAQGAVDTNATQDDRIESARALAQGAVDTNATQDDRIESARALAQGAVDVNATQDDRIESARALAQGAVETNATQDDRIESARALAQGAVETNATQDDRIESTRALAQGAVDVNATQDDRIEEAHAAARRAAEETAAQQTQVDEALGKATRAVEENASQDLRIDNAIEAANNAAESNVEQDTLILAASNDARRALEGVARHTPRLEEVEAIAGRADARNAEQDEAISAAHTAATEALDHSNSHVATIEMATDTANRADAMTRDNEHRITGLIGRVDETSEALERVTKHDNAQDERIEAAMAGGFDETQLDLRLKDTLAAVTGAATAGRLRDEKIDEALNLARRANEHNVGQDKNIAEAVALGHAASNEIGRFGPRFEEMSKRDEVLSERIDGLTNERDDGGRLALPDDLTRIKGVGRVLEERLNAIGIYQFRQIAEFEQRDIERVRQRIGAFEDRIERDDWIPQAKLLAAGRTPTPKPKRTVRKQRTVDGDDLQRIHGIGPVLERRLHTIGIKTFADIAKLDAQRIDEVQKTIGSFADRVVRERWIEQARALL